MSSPDKSHKPPPESSQPSKSVLRDDDDGDDDGKISPWALIVGPCFTAGGLSRVLGLSEAGILEAAEDLRILSLRTADGHDLFPGFQVRDGRIHPGMQSVLTTLRGGIDDSWTWALWLRGPGPDGVTGMEQLWQGDLAAVLRDARHDAWAWSA